MKYDGGSPNIKETFTFPEEPVDDVHDLLRKIKIETIKACSFVLFMLFGEFFAHKKR